MSYSGDEFEQQYEEHEGDVEDIPENVDYGDLVARDTTGPRADVDEGDPNASAGGGYGSISDAMDSMADLSDVQSALMLMFPQDLGGKRKNRLMMARLIPEAELPFMHLLTTDDVMSSDPEMDIDVVAFIGENTTLLSIGRDGMGRIDGAEMIGAARDQKQIDKMMRYGE